MDIYYPKRALKLEEKHFYTERYLFSNPVRLINPVQPRKVEKNDPAP